MLSLSLAYGFFICCGVRQHDGTDGRHYAFHFMLWPHIFAAFLSLPRSRLRAYFSLPFDASPFILSDSWGDFTMTEDFFRILRHIINIIRDDARLFAWPLWDEGSPACFTGSLAAECGIY